MVRNDIPIGYKYKYIVFLFYSIVFVCLIELYFFKP